MSLDLSTVKFGKLPPAHPFGHPMLADFVKAPYSSLPAPFDNSKGVVIELDGNGPDPAVTDQGPGFQGVGDCGVVGAVNKRRVDRTLILNDSAIAATILAKVAKIDLPTANKVVAAYLKFTAGVDAGVVLVTFLEYLRTVGIDGVKILAHAKVDHRNKAEFYGATHDFGATYNGYALAQPFMTQAQALIENPGNPPIDLTGTAADRKRIGGHCMVETTMYLPEGDTMPLGKLGTWGFWLPRTEAWRMRYMDESHVFVTEEQVTAHGNGLNLNAEHLVDVLDELAKDVAA